MRIVIFFLVGLFACSVWAAPENAGQTTSANEQKDPGEVKQPATEIKQPTTTGTEPETNLEAVKPETAEPEPAVSLDADNQQLDAEQDQGQDQESMADAGGEIITDKTEETQPTDKQDTASAEQSEASNIDRQHVLSPEKEKIAGVDKENIAGLVGQLNKLNDKISSVYDEDKISQLLDRERQIIERLIILLRRTEIDRLPAIIDPQKSDFLRSRIKINEERGNSLAVKRDHIKLTYYKTLQGISEYLQYLISASRNFTSVDDIVSYSVEKNNQAREDIKQIELPATELTSSVYIELDQNFRKLQRASNTYQNILTYVINNPNKIASTHWFQKFTLLSAISFFNEVDFIKPVNRKLTPFRVDVGGIIISVLIVILVVFCYPLVVKGSSWLVEKYLITGDESGNSELIYRQLNRPIWSLLVFFSLDLATYALLYKTEFKASLESFVFVVYAWIYVWLLFKLLDSVVIVQLTKIARTNKELRKELINLGIQLAKGVIFIAAAAIILNRFGISITAILSTLGIGGLAFALAAKDTLSNLFGGVTILLDNVFRMGDWVTIADVEGTVAVIGLRSTTIRTFDNALITIPNSLVSVSSVKNWNRRAVGRRIKMYIGVTYESNMNDIRQALEDIRNMLKDHPEIADPKEKQIKRVGRNIFTSHEDTHGIKSTQLVFLDRFNDFSIDILIYCFSRSVDWAEWLAVKEDVLYKIAEIIKKNNLEFAYPTAVRVHRMDYNSGENSELIMEKNGELSMNDSVDSLG